MVLEIKRTRDKYLAGFFSRRLVQYPECWYCGRSARQACLTCEDHSLRENDAEQSLKLALANTSIAAHGLPQCFSCHCPYLTNTSTINVCDSCLLQAITDDDDKFQD